MSRKKLGGMRVSPGMSFRLVSWQARIPSSLKRGWRKSRGLFECSWLGVCPFFCSISFHPRANNKQRRKPARKSKLPIPIPQPPHILHHHLPNTHIPLPPLTHLRPSTKNPTSDRRYPQESRDGREECGGLASFGCAVDEYAGLGSGENGGRGWVESVGGEG